MKTPLIRYLYATLVIALALPMLTFPNSAQAQQTLGIAAVVNEEVISFFDLDSRVSLLLASSNQKNTPENRQRHTRQILDQLINEKLQLQEAKRLGVNISTQEKDNAFNNLARSNKMTPQQLVEFLHQTGVEKDVLIDQLQAQISWGRAVNILFRSEVSIGNEEIDEVIAEISKSEGKPEYLVADIFLPVETPEHAEKQLNSANNIISQLKSGASFSVMARNFSQSATAAVGGDLGWVRHGQLPAELEVSIASLADGALSGPIRTVSGVHILFKRKSRIGQGIGSESTEVDLYQVYSPLPPTPSKSDISAGLAAAEQLTAGATGCEAMEEIGKQTGSSLSGRLGKVKVSSLPSQTQNLLKSLDVGKPGKPIQSGDGIIVLMICDRSGSVSAATIRDNIEANLLNKRLDILARRHLRDLRRTAFLDVRI